LISEAPLAVWSAGLSAWSDHCQNMAEVLKKGRKKHFCIGDLHAAENISHHPDL
jgi:hypothetical protein